jgi:hypothetical protein
MYHWTLSGCPRCARTNERHPGIAFCKVIAVVALGAAIFVVARLAITHGVGTANESKPKAKRVEEPAGLHLFSRPTPAPSQELTFSR